METTHFPRKTARQQVTHSIFSADYKFWRPKLMSDLSHCRVYYLAYGKWAINIFKGQSISPVDFPYGRKNDALAAGSSVPKDQFCSKVGTS